MVTIFLFLINFCIFRICSTPKLAKYVTFSAFTYNAIQRVPIGSYSSRFIINAPSFVFHEIFLEQAPSNFDNNLYFKIGYRTRWNENFSRAFITPSRALNTLFPANAFPNILSANVPGKIRRNPPFCSFILFLNVLLISFIKIPDYSSDLIIFIIFSVSSFEISNAVSRKGKSKGRTDP